MTDADQPQAAAPAAPPGWYPDASGQQRYWDGTDWTTAYAPTGPVAAAGPRMSGLAITGFVLSLVAILASTAGAAVTIVGVLALLFSGIGYTDAKPGVKHGRGLAIAGIVVSLVAIAVTISYAVLIGSRR